MKSKSNEHPRNPPDQPGPSVPRNFVPLQHSPEPVLERPRTRGLDDYLIFTSPCSFTAYVPDSLIQRAMAMAERALPNEFIGLCAGQVFRDDRGRYLVVAGIIPDLGARTAPGRVETTADSEFATRQSLAALFPDCVPVGWCHSHVGIGAFFSMADRQNQATWSKDYHIGIVVDARLRELAVFRGPEAQKLERADAQAGDPADAAVSRKGASPPGRRSRSARRLQRALTSLARFVKNPRALFSKLTSPRLIPLLFAIQAIQAALLLFLVFG